MAWYQWVAVALLMYAAWGFGYRCGRGVSRSYIRYYRRELERRCGTNGWTDARRR